MSAGRKTSDQAKAWYQASLKPWLPTSFIRFIALWEAVCAWDRDVNKRENDAELRCCLKKKLAAWHANRLADPSYREKVNSLQRETPIWRMKGSTRRDQSRAITDAGDFDQVIEAIYTVRCNLLKGGKRPSPAGRDNAVCDAASGVLGAIVTELLETQPATEDATGNA